MNIGKLAKTNTKGQIVIPQEYREKLGINSSVTLNIVAKENGIFIEPVDKVVSMRQTEDTYDQVLDATAGSWISDSDEESIEVSKRKKELDASRRRKKGW